MSRKKITIDALFSNRLRNFIEDILKIKREDFRKKIGISKGYLAMVLTGARGPSAELIAGLFIHYRDHLYWLLTGNPDPHKNNTIVEDIGNESLSELFSMTKDILKSETDYAFSLIANIKSFHKSIKMEERISALENKLLAMPNDHENPPCNQNKSKDILVQKR